jgi:hypothetical protein
MKEIYKKMKVGDIMREMLRGGGQFFVFWLFFDDCIM